MPQRFSKQNQSPATAYRFGDFELSPRDRLLKHSSIAVPLQPKAFDALLCLVQRAQHLVSKEELMQTLWPEVHVSEANLTNTIGSLRKVLGREAISTASKHGYRFELQVGGEPGIASANYERFMRARDLTAQRSVESMRQARDLYWICLAEDPTFAPAWAWLGRCCWFLDKFTRRSQTNMDLAQAVLQRAFAIDPELAVAHQFYTLVEVDIGRASEAMERILSRLKQHPGEPESLTSLVQVFRFRGLLRESIDAHRRAVKLDPAIVTSVAHTFFLTGDFAAAIEAYGGRAAYYLDAAAWAALGHPKRAIALLQERLATMQLSRLMTALLASLMALLEGRTEEAVRLMKRTHPEREPEVLFYFARHYARMKLAAPAVQMLHRIADLGFVCAPETLREDPWLRTVRSHPEFNSLLASSEQRCAQARSSLAGS